ncbi:hypothetical protein HAX54_043731 [Datura stramonium]|uniref:Uncharacterized protein n=1 Tax=Datura stramonium TaxID=4076 RepID=A0ABS8SP16_DATST|nr:hypothetical protein [Datura stramonium]
MAPKPSREREWLLQAMVPKGQEELMTSKIRMIPINVEEIIKYVLRRERVKKGQRFGFGSLLTQFFRSHQIEEEVVDYRPMYDLKGIDVTKTKDPEGIHGPFLSIGERHVRLNNMLSHLYGMQMLQLRMNGVTEEQLQ